MFVAAHQQYALAPLKQRKRGLWSVGVSISPLSAEDESQEQEEQAKFPSRTF